MFGNREFVLFRTEDYKTVMPSTFAIETTRNILCFMDNTNTDT